MKNFAVVLALAFALVFVSAEESSNEANAEKPKNSEHRFGINFNENGTPGRKAGLERVKELLHKSGLKRVEQDNTQNREKRGLVHHQPVQHYEYQYDCPEYQYEYCYEPQYQHYG